MSNRSLLFDQIASFIKSLYPNDYPILLHTPRFNGNEKKYLKDCIDTTFVSYVGKYVTDFENHVKAMTGAAHASAMVNGTTALQIALSVAGVSFKDEVITQALTFVATANAIKHCGGTPVFIDVDRQTMGMSHEALLNFFRKNTVAKNNQCINKITGKHIAACVPVHTFGHPVQIDEIVRICDIYNVPVIEDAAESLGSIYKGKHTGRFGKAGIVSFNGNKIVTTGGGGMIITDDEMFASRVRHISTTAKVPHKYEFFHDEIGYNYRMPNVNAAIGCAQMEQLPEFLSKKRMVADLYRSFFAKNGILFINEPAESHSNYWLNTLVLSNRSEREQLLEYMNSAGIQCRPVWRLMTDLPMYQDCFSDGLETARWFVDRVVNIPSSVTV